MCKTLFRGKPTNLIDLDALPEYHKWVKDGWVYGYLIGKNVIVGEIVDFEEGYLKTEFLCRVKPETVGRFTGLKDRKGVEIYKGSIIKTVALANDHSQRGGIEISVVRYFKGNPSLFPVGCNFGVAIYPLCIVHTLEVIGNIWDNPELLEA